jgi:nicotinamidase-related amidase
MKRAKRVLCTALAVLVSGVDVPAADERSCAQETPVAQSPATLTVRGREIPNTVDEILNPKHTAVIVHEMVNDLVSLYQPEQMSRLLPPIQKLLSAAHEKGVRVIYVRYTHHADGSTSSDAIRRNKFSGEPEDRSTIEGEPGWQVIDALKPQPQDLVLRKYRPDAFYGTILDSILRWNGIKTVVIVGVGIAVGVVPTITTASNLGYFRVAVSDCLLSTDQNRTVAAMTYLSDHAIVRTHAEVIDIWNRSASRPSGFVVSATSRQTGEPSSVMFEGREIPVSLEEILNPKHTAVLVYQMQNDFIAPGGACDARGCRYEPARIAKVLPAIQTLLSAARAKGVRVVYLRNTSLPDGVTFSDPQIRTFGGENRGRLPTPLAMEGTRGWQIVDALKPTQGDVILSTYRPDAFFGTILDSLLKWNGIKTVVFVGIDADTGGLQTLMRAWYLGYFRVTVTDGMLSSRPNPMAFAATYLSTAMPKTHREVIDIWNHRP